MHCIGSFMRWDAVIFKVKEIVHFRLTRDSCFMQKNRSLSILWIRGALFSSAGVYDKAWKMKQSHKPPRFLSGWSDFPSTG